MMRRLLAMAGVVLSCNAVMAQAGWTIYNSTNSNLNSGTYRAVEIDQAGNIWVGGSYNGVAKFNGSSWTKYSTTNSGLLHSDVNAIAIDNSSNIWIGTYQGLSRFDGSAWTSFDTTNTPMNGITVYTLAVDYSNKLWVASRNGSFGYEGITTYDGSTWANLTGYPSQIQGGEMTDFAFAGPVAWIGGNGITRYNGSFTFYPYSTTGLWSSQSTAVDLMGGIWAGGFDGLLKYNGSVWTMYTNASLGFPGNTLYYKILPGINVLWIATSKGLVKYNTSNGSMVIYNSANSPLPDNSVTDIAMDSQGMLWLSTTIGIVKMDPAVASIGIEEVTPSVVNAYPNPTTGLLYIETAASGASVEITDIFGKVVFSELSVNENVLQLDMSGHARGNYLVTVRSGHSVKRGKIVLQ